jgi:hypothetical protein
LDASVRYEP